MSKVLITGALGFTGQHLFKWLVSNGYDVIGTKNNCKTTINGIIECDITNIDSISHVLKANQPDYIIHLAGISHANNSDINNLLQVNLFGTANLLQSAFQNTPDVKKIILASSANIYGNNEIKIIDESVSPNPVNSYAHSKLSMEYMSHAFFNKLPITIVRPFNYTGVGQSKSFLIPKIVSHFKRKSINISLGNLDVSRDFSDVRDICKAYHLLLDADASGKTINLCSSTITSLGKVINICEDLTGHKTNVTVDPSFVRHNEIKELRGNNELLHSIIGSFQYRDFEETLSWMLNFSKSDL